MKLNYIIKHQTKTSIGVELPLTKDMSIFDGHFESVAIMPAVAQLYIIEKISRTELGLEGKFKSMHQIKFAGPIFPGAIVNIYITYNKPKQQISFKYIYKDVVKSKGRIHYSEWCNP